MPIYKYFCEFCGEIEEVIVFHGSKYTCGKCKRTKRLYSMYKTITDKEV